MAKKESVKYTSIIENIKKGDIKPIYLLHGEETYYIDQISNYIENNLVSDDAKDLDLKVYYGLDCKLNDVIVEAMQFPMIGDRNVVIVKEAQNLEGLKDSKKDSEDGSSSTKALLNYAKNPNPNAVLVLCHKYKKLDSRKAYYKAIENSGVVFTADKPYENEIPKIIDDILKERGFSIEPKAKEMLITYVGTNIQSIVNEIVKITSLLQQGATITYDMVAKSVGVSREFNPFELLDAVARKDVNKANFIALKLAGDKVAIEMVVAAFFGFFQKMCVFYHIFKNNIPDRTAVMSNLKENYYSAERYIEARKAYSVFQIIKAIEILRTADERSKGLNVSPLISRTEILQELVYSLIHCKGIGDAF